jgi:uncharacterized protein (TIGR02594 family)
MSLPTRYYWLNKIGLLPRTISEGLKLHGITEVVGRGSNRTIMSWRDELNKAGAGTITGYTDDDIPWCGLFAAIVVYRRVWNIREVVSSPLWARNWTTYGHAVRKAALGDVLVFTRGKGGHVGFYIGEDSACYHVLGGNQSNAVTITRIQKSRCIARRRPAYMTMPPSVRPYILAATGTISTNEA